MIFVRFVLPLLLQAVTWASVSAQREGRTIRGMIVDRDHRLLNGVRLRVLGTGLMTSSDSLGRFILVTQAADTLTLRLLAVGFGMKDVQLHLPSDSSVVITLEASPAIQFRVDTTPLRSGVVLSLAYGRTRPRAGGTDTVGIALASEELFGCLMQLHTVQTQDSAHTYLHALGTGQEVCGALVGHATWYSSLILKVDNQAPL